MSVPPLHPLTPTFHPPSIHVQYGLSTYIDHQVATIQELPETAPPGQLPRSVEVVLEDDLRDACKPGDRVAVVGVYKPIAPGSNGASSAIFRAVVAASGVRRLGADAAAPAITEADYDNIVGLSRDPALMEVLASSLAPSIYGYAWVKKALLLLLVGGRERTLASGTHLRGDVNCLLVGDPGVAKSQLLRAVMSLAPLAVSTTGRGSSGVGLTAAVTMDPDTGATAWERKQGCGGCWVWAPALLLSVRWYAWACRASQAAGLELATSRGVLLSRSFIWPFPSKHPQPPTQPPQTFTSTPPNLHLNPTIRRAAA